MPSLPFSTEKKLSYALTTTLVLVIIGIVAVFALIVQPHCCKNIRCQRPQVQVVEGCPSSGNAEADEQREEHSEHEYDVIRLPTIPEDTTSERSANGLPAADSSKYRGIYASPYEAVNFDTVGQYSMLYATADTRNNVENVGGGYNIGTDEADKRSGPIVICEARETSLMDEVVPSATENRDNAVVKDMEPQQATATEAHND